MTDWGQLISLPCFHLDSEQCPFSDQANDLVASIDYYYYTNTALNQSQKAWDMSPVSNPV